MTESKELAQKKNKKDMISNQILEKAFLAANYCYNCNRCVYVCPLSLLGSFNPRSLLQDLNSLSLEEVIKSHNIWQCLTCGQCSIYCPMTQEKTGVRIPELILQLRTIAKIDADQYEKIAQCETHDEIITLMTTIMADEELEPDKLGFLEGTSLKTRKTGDIAYFIGCMPLMGDMFDNLKINYIDIPTTIIALFNEAGISPVVLNEKCCGHDMLWGKGDLDVFKKLAEYNVKLYKDAGVKTVIVGCAEGYRTWKYDYPKVIPNFDIEVFHFSEFFLKRKTLETLRLPHQQELKVTYHDACRMGRLGGKLYDAPRDLIKQIPGVELVEMEHIRDDAYCCGVSAFMGCNETTRVIRQNRIEEAIKTGADYLIVPCPKCLTHFTCFLTEPSLEEEYREYKNLIKVVDLATFIGKVFFLI